MLTKSKLMAWRQCPKRLWLEANEPPLERSPPARLTRGQTVGDLARSLFAAPNAETLLRSGLTPTQAVARTAERLASGATVFEGAFGDDELIVYADVARANGSDWTLVEVKDSGSIKPHHLDDAAIQFAAAQRSGVGPSQVLIAHIDTSWVYPGGSAYQGLLKEVDVTDEARRLADAVDAWIVGARATLSLDAPPPRATGRHCDEPNPCPYQESCRAAEPRVEQPLAWLPGQLRKPAKTLRAGGARDMRELTDDTLSELQLRVKRQTQLGVEYFDRPGAASDVASWAYPLHFLDFETVNPAIPIWAGTRPYAQIPFQFSLHRLDAHGGLQHHAFLMASGEDPSRPFAEALVECIGQDGSVVVYNAAFEVSRMRELATRFPDLAPALNAIVRRAVDLQPVAKQRYYHPAQQGSWSIKKVLPCLGPELRYEALEGIQDGSMAIEAYLELLAPECEAARRDVLEAQLLEYCCLDTLAMVTIWACFSRSDLPSRDAPPPEVDRTP